jgi:2-iminobutanoate/2-iminopropanoate deaminase
MYSRITRASGVVLLCAIFPGGCGPGYTISTATPNWPESPGMTPEETRAKREAEIDKYRQPPPGTAGAPASSGARRPSRKVETAAIAPSDAPAASRYGDLLFISGQLPLDARGNTPPADAGAEEHARLALENVRSILEANRLTMANVVSMTVYLSDLGDLRAFDAVAPGFFKGALPSRSVVEVSRLPGNAKVQVSAVAGR